jgi:hypothetical protein
MASSASSGSKPGKDPANQAGRAEVENDMIVMLDQLMGFVERKRTCRTVIKCVKT